jgi:hypothetical protein
MHAQCSNSVSPRCAPALVATSNSLSPPAAWARANECATFRLYKSIDQTRNLGRLCPIYNSTTSVEDMSPDERYQRYIGCVVPCESGVEHSHPHPTCRWPTHCFSLVSGQCSGNYLQHSIPGGLYHLCDCGPGAYAQHHGHHVRDRYTPLSCTCFNLTLPFSTSHAPLTVGVLHSANAHTRGCGDRPATPLPPEVLSLPTYPDVNPFLVGLVDEGGDTLHELSEAKARDILDGTKTLFRATSVSGSERHGRWYPPMIVGPNPTCTACLHASSLWQGNTALVS